MIATFAAAGSPNWNEQPTNFVAPANAPASTSVWLCFLWTYMFPTSMTIAAEGEDHRNQQREEHDDLTALVAAAVGGLADLPRSPCIRPPQDV